MNISFIDESGISKESKYFILGITTLSESACEKLKISLSELKNKNSIPPNVEVKWNLNDFNRQLKKNNLARHEKEDHRKLKSEIIKLLEPFTKNDVSILWYLSPLFFFKMDEWRSYKFAFSDSLERLSMLNENQNTKTIALIDELGQLGLKKSDKRKLLEDLILNMESNNMCNHVNLIVPGVNSTLSFGHQLNDMVVGALNNFVVQLFSEHHDGISKGILEIIGKLGKFEPSIMIKPERPQREDLQSLNNTTYTNLRKYLKQ